jgi:putative heme-binding domain-containing protein
MSFKLVRFAIDTCTRLALVLGSIALLLAGSPSVRAGDPFAENVRTTEPQAPDDERKGFTVPPGFEVQLVASEPLISKPLNMAFDDRGRLWLTDTLEYPYAAPLGKPSRDTIKILDGIGEDGRAKRISTFADNCNIPLGVYPYQDGAIAWSIPNIYRFHDDDHDGRSEKRDVLFGPFDYSRDTHGMNNAFRRGFDGWLYACHGYNNHTVVRGKDGNTVRMNSGNTYRMRLDGSRIEHFTHGQVNPFGMTIDELGNLFTADCHSKPVYQLLRGGFYPSFGAPDDGLGFVPPMMDHLHGSTAIAGVVYCASDAFPGDLRGNLLSGNVMTSRVNRNRLEYHGSTIVAIEQPDFVIAKDPWFRPVDIQLGPDGALYIADFYNRIIGHYEVPLPHPGRDRFRGRIWRIVYRGDGKTATPTPPDLSRNSVAELITLLDANNLTLRLLATNRLVDHYPGEAAAPVKAAFDKSQSPRLRSHAIWILSRIGKLDDDTLAAAARDAHRDVRVHAMKILSEMNVWTAAQRTLAASGAADADGFVARAAADALGRHPQAEQIDILLAMLAKTPADDNHRTQTIRMALRDHFLRPELLAKFRPATLDEQTSRTVAAVVVAAPTSASADFLVTHVQRFEEPPDVLRRYVEHAARNISTDKLGELAAVVQRRFAGDLDLQTNLFTSLRAGMAQRGATDPPALRQWAKELAEKLLASATGDAVLSWTNTPLAERPAAGNPWTNQPRDSADGDHGSLFFSSLPRGEQGTGSLRSSPFPAPKQLSFFAAGHVGPPGEKVVAKNFIRLRDAATDRVLIEAMPPRNDVAQKITWNLSGHAGKQVYVEIVDGDTRDAYAWLAVGRFSLAALNPSAVQSRMRTAAELCGSMKLAALAPELKKRLLAESLDRPCSAAIAGALVAIEPDRSAAALAALLGDAAVPAPLLAKAKLAIANRQPKEVSAALSEALKTLPERLQLIVAEQLAADVAGAETLAAAVEAGQASARLIVRPSVRQRLAALKSQPLAERLAKLTAGLPSEDQAIARTIEARKAGYRTAGASAERGKLVFTKTCAACHQIAGQGAVVGPQLDGIGNRGLERVHEDVRDPNRNVDVAFRTSTFRMEGGEIVSGLVRREAGATIILADDKGKEFSVKKDDIEAQTKTQISLMPANVHEIVPEKDFYDLIAFLLEQRGTPAEKSTASPPRTTP